MIKNSKNNTKARAVADVANVASAIKVSSKKVSEIAREKLSIILNSEHSQATVEGRENPYKVWIFPT